MQFSRITTALILGACLVGLSACSKKPATSGDIDGDGSQGAQSYGVSSGETYGSDGLPRDSNGMVRNPLTAPSNQTYYFSFDGAEPRQEDYEAMKIQADYLAAHPRARIRLEGNTDNRGSREYNIGLGWRRDQAVANYFKQQGVASGQIEMVSYGKERPVRLGDNESAWQVNRRVDLRYEVK